MVHLAKLIPLDVIEERYAELFSESHGAPAITAREAVASLIIKEKRKPGAKRVRKAIGKQLRYIARNLSTIGGLAPGRLRLLSRRQYRNLLVCARGLPAAEADVRLTHALGEWTNSEYLAAAHVRPIVRGKAAASVEPGANISRSKVDRFVYLDHLSWEPYHGSEDLPEAVETFHRGHGHYPRSVHVDAIYRTRANRYCKEPDIRISGPPLGRPKKHPGGEEKRQTLSDERARIPIEGAVGRSKRAFSLSRVMAKRTDTAGTSIAMVVLVMNLEALLSLAFLALYFALSVLGIRADRSRRKPETLLPCAV